MVNIDLSGTARMGARPLEGIPDGLLYSHKLVFTGWMTVQVVDVKTDLIRPVSRCTGCLTVSLSDVNVVAKISCPSCPEL